MLFANFDTTESATAVSTVRSRYAGPPAKTSATTKDELSTSEGPSEGRIGLPEPFPAGVLAYASLYARGVRQFREHAEIVSESRYTRHGSVSRGLPVGESPRFSEVEPPRYRSQIR
jgi:hypothetical protein